MPTTQVSTFFENAAGQILAHADGYAVLRYLPGKRQPTDLATLLTHLGRLLLAHGWHSFLADNRHMTPLDPAEKEWFVQHWLGRGGQPVPRPVPLYGCVVLPTEVVARLSITQMVGEADAATLLYRTFIDYAEAERYLAGLAQRRPR